MKIRMEKKKIDNNIYTHSLKYFFFIFITKKPSLRVSFFLNNKRLFGCVIRNNVLF